MELLNLGSANQDPNMKLNNNPFGLEGFLNRILGSWSTASRSPLPERPSPKAGRPAGQGIDKHLQALQLERRAHELLELNRILCSASTASRSPLPERPSLKAGRPVGQGIDKRLQALQLERRAHELLERGLQPFARPLDVDELVGKEKEKEVKEVKEELLLRPAPPQVDTPFESTPAATAGNNRIQRTPTSPTHDEYPPSWRAYPEPAVIVGAAARRGTLLSPLEAQQGKQKALDDLRSCFYVFNKSAGIRSTYDERSLPGLSPADVLSMLTLLLPDAPPMSLQDACDFISDHEEGDGLEPQEGDASNLRLSFDGFVRGMISLVRQETEGEDGEGERGGGLPVHAFFETAVIISAAEAAMRAVADASKPKPAVTLSLKLNAGVKLDLCIDPESLEA